MAVLVEIPGVRLVLGRQPGRAFRVVDQRSRGTRDHRFPFPLRVLERSTTVVFGRRLAVLGLT